jgi:iron complex outermembrane receptor protein
MPARCRHIEKTDRILQIIRLFCEKDNGYKGGETMRRASSCDVAGIINNNEGDAPRNLEGIIMEKSRKISYLASISIVAFGMVPAGAQAQSIAGDADPATQPASVSQESVDPSGISDIIVTAERRTSSVQRTSIPIEVLGSDALKNAGVSQATDLTRLTAGVQIGAVGPTPQVYIRGVGDFGSTAVSNPAVAFNIDGIYVARTQAISGNFYDVQRVEILKGPQGTLYGRNASGGAVNVITNRPVLDKTSATIAFEAGNYSAIMADGAVNLPVTHNLAIRAAYQISHRDGYSSTGLGDDKHQSVRLQAYWEPRDGINLLVSGDYTHVGGLGPSFVVYPKLAGRSAWTDITDPEVAALYQAASPFPGAINGPSAARAGQDMVFKNIHAEFNADLGFATLTVLPSYRDAKMSYTTYPTFEYRVGQDLGPFPDNPETSKATTVEARLGHESGKLKWVVGGYFFDEKQHADSLVYSGLIQNSFTQPELRSRSYAAFGQATFALSPTLRIIAGGRYTYDRREAVSLRKYNIFPSQGCLDPATPACLVEDLAGRRVFRNFSWKGGLEFDVAPQSMAYATISRGFKAGGLSLSGSLEGGSSPSTYRPEILTAYEFGIKNRFLDNRLQVNLEAFYWDYKDHQESLVTLDGNGVIGQSFVNAGKARQYGGSLDIVGRPTQSDTLRVAVEYLNSKYTEFLYQQPAAFLAPGSSGCKLTPASGTSLAGPLVNVDCSGFQLTRAPKWTGNASYAHRFDLADGSNIEAQAGMTFASSRWLGPEFIPNERAPSYISVDTSLRYTLDNENISITAFVRNVTNEKVYTGGIQSPFIPGLVAANISPPRTYGARAEFKF